MRTQEIVTSDISHFGRRERELLIDLLSAWNQQGLPDDFYDENVIPMSNGNSGYIFLTNSEHQVCMMNDDKLEMWYTCSNCGHEGFAEDCKVEDEHCNECKEEDE
jgi:hypothetical protein